MRAKTNAGKPAAEENPYLKHCGVYGAKWNLKGVKPVAEQIKRKHS